MSRRHRCSDGCETLDFLRALVKLLDCNHHNPYCPEYGLLAVLGFGTPEDANAPVQTQEYTIMTVGNIGERIPLLPSYFQADRKTPATIDGKESYVVADPAIAEVREMDGKMFAVILAQGSTTIELTVDADRTGRRRELKAVGLIVGNDPASEAQIAELNLGESEPMPEVVEPTPEPEPAPEPVPEPEPMPVEETPVEPPVEPTV